MSLGARIELPNGALEALAQRAADIVIERLRDEHPNGSPWLSMAEAAEYLRVSKRQVQRLVSDDRVRSSFVGRRRLLHRDDLDKAATGEDVAPTTSPHRRGE